MEEYFHDPARGISVQGIWSSRYIRPEQRTMIYVIRDQDALALLYSQYEIKPGYVREVSDKLFPISLEFNAEFRQDDKPVVNSLPVFRRHITIEDSFKQIHKAIEKITKRKNIH